MSLIAGDHKIDLSGIEMDNDLRPESQAMKEIKLQFLRRYDALSVSETGVHRFDYLFVTVSGAEAIVWLGASGLLENLEPGARVYAKGHPEPSSTDDPTLSRKANDVFAWKKLFAGYFSRRCIQLCK